ncbi:histidine kinase [Streptomyces sp. NPDC050732]|uniref:histidine kinase n=1 Tax=Streptomyces sp. NPDC050732 TaxID=3154632 RepID=UPI00343E5DA5
MDRIRNWLLPVLLAIQQLAYWPGRALREDEPVGAGQLVAAFTAAVVITAALGVRRHRPVASAVTVEAALIACLLLPEDATLLHALSLLVALFSVAVRCCGRTVAVVGSALAVCEAGRSALLLDSAVEAAGETAVNCVLFLTVAGLGRSRRRWLAGRRAAARELARAESERARAALTERERLARELHDVSAHHLTSVVVTADAALRLADRRPELTAQALKFAAESGRDTLTALHRLVTLMRTAAADEESALADRVAELAAGFARLGPRPAVDVAPDLAALTGPVADAAFGIVREALTNALRYAPGATVRVHIHATEPDGPVDLTIEDDGAAAATPARQNLGSGRGTTGMRERAAALNGTLTTGPRPDGPGWSVRARLPRGTADIRAMALDGMPPTAGPRGDGPGWSVGARLPRGTAGMRAAVLDGGPAVAAAGAGGPGWSVWARLPRGTGALRRRAVNHPALRGLDLSDVAVALAVGTLPVFAVLVEEPAAAALALVPAVAHALPLLWRRRAPWAVLCAVLATALLGPLGLAFGLLSPAVALCLVMAGGVAECVAVYAVGAFAGPARVTWLAAGLAAVGLSLTSIALASADGIANLEEDGGSGLLLFLCAVLSVFFLAPMAALWGLGAVVRTRRERVRAWEDHALTATVWSAVAEAHEERRRIAAELRGEVLRHAGAVVARAEAGDLPGVAAGARAALSSMRDLLAQLREVTGPGDVREPQPTAAAPDMPTARQTV